MINRPIRSEAEYKTALAEIETYFEREPRKNTPEADRFDLLTLLIEAYEEQHHPIGPPHPVEMIRHRMRTAGYTQADLAELLGSRARASEVLAKKRRLTLPMIWKLSRQWKIAAEALVAPYRLTGDRRRRPSSRTNSRRAA
jgi:HTH-type transcriptional regulator/antitoxin HigA